MSPAGRTDSVLNTYAELNSFIDTHKDEGCEYQEHKGTCEYDCPFIICVKYEWDRSEWGNRTLKNLERFRK